MWAFNYSHSSEMWAFNSYEGRGMRRLNIPYIKKGAAACDQLPEKVTDPA